MDKIKGRKPTFKSQTSAAPKAMQEDFKPVVEWAETSGPEDQANRILIIHLPGFKREDIMVQLNNAGKLLVKGVKQVGDKYLNVDLSFDVPKDTINEKISGRFEDERLTLVMPKRVVKEEATGEEQADSEQKWEEPTPEHKPGGAKPKREEEAIQKEAKPTEDKEGEGKEREPTAAEATEKEPTQKAAPKGIEDSKDETIRTLNPKTEEEKKDDGAEKGRGEEKKGEPVEKSESAEGEKKEDPFQARTKAAERGNEGKAIQKMKSKVREICADKPKQLMKKVSTWRGSEVSHGSFVRVLEKINRNRKVIAVAVVAFSVGFYVSRKLKTSGR